jgi:hypothetical protein
MAFGMMVDGAGAAAKGGAMDTERWGLCTSRMQLTHSLKAPGLEPCAYSLESAWFQTLRL